MSNNSFGLKEFYLSALGLLPILAMVSLFHIESNWNLVEHYNQSETVAGFLILFYSFIGFFISGIFGLLFVQLSPYPKSHLLGMIMLFDTPIELLIVQLLGSDFSIDQLLILDFMIESFGLVVACFLFVLIKNNFVPKETKTLYWIIVLQGLTILSGVYFLLTYSWLTNKNWLVLFSLAVGVTASILLYYRILSEQLKENKKIETKNIPAKIAVIAMLVCWAYVVAGIIRLI